MVKVINNSKPKERRTYYCNRRNCRSGNLCCEYCKEKCVNMCILNPKECRYYISLSTENLDSDMVHHPNHYNYKSVECIDLINIMCEGLEGSIAYDIGTVIKYLYRFPKKENAIQDLEKCKTYIDMAIEKIKKGEEDDISI